MASPNLGGGLSSKPPNVSTGERKSHIVFYSLVIFLIISLLIYYNKSYLNPEYKDEPIRINVSEAIGVKTEPVTKGYNGSLCNEWTVGGVYKEGNEEKEIKHYFKTLSDLRGFCDLGIDVYLKRCSTSRLMEETGQNITLAQLICTNQSEGFVIYTGSGVKI